MSTDSDSWWPIDRATAEALARSSEAILITDSREDQRTAVRLARAIHDAGPRRLQPFLHISCAGLPADVLRSELFGHPKNAAAGLFREKQGLMQVARGGTLCLLSVEWAPDDVQARLCQIADAAAVREGGAPGGQEADVRLIAIVSSAKNRQMDPFQRLSKEFLRCFTRVPVGPV